MACSTERLTRGILAVLAALALQGCVTGHMLDYAREIERPVAYRDAALDGDRLLLAYDTVVINERGRRLARRARRAAVALADLERDLPVDAFPVVRLPDDTALTGRHVALDGRPGETPALEIETGPDGRQTSFVLHDAKDGPRRAFQSAALSRTHVAPWIYPLLPLAFAVDAVSNPVLLLFAPAVMMIGD
jgi:hypothetical protein